MLCDSDGRVLYLSATDCNDARGPYETVSLLAQNIVNGEQLTNLVEVNSAASL